ncbi:S-layer homology domain-containing protein [Ureibacillus thermosphaericus]|uniref:Exopolysaccharide biosynthesis protein n=1 Tax=Ureibacillus thermosphaericus TaxID=51173 RepID=A0A840Q1Z2_URETH|nr:S-layer homology domain-containing protein [Ureibacillus thermosphaericus]MBB5149066.1 exopolysaccharide biosynthesis protein [Ureibacillus thermosphaericus]NKZ31830.1 Parasporal protein [Ureibacillus thermosphaericus]
MRALFEQNQMKKIISILFAFVLLFGTVAPAQANQSVNEQYPVSSGVVYSQYTYKTSKTNVINHLSINLNDPFTKVDIGLPSAYNKRETVTAIANRDSKDGNRVVGAINAAFFNMSDGVPLFLIAKNNRIINGGAISEGADQYLNVPTAFGIDKNGQGIIDYFDFQITMTTNGQSYQLTGMDRVRNGNEAIVYTPNYYKGYTDNNQYGFDIIVEGDTPIGEIYFGDTISGVVKEIAPYGESKHPIPKNGFILSVQGGSPLSKTLSSLQIGQQIDVNFSIDSKWQDAQFIVATGPFLVRDGKPYIMMSTASSRAREVAPRTVVAVSKDKKTVHFITVDGRQSHSKGMNMKELADYLVSLGVDTAINLDGGGSTTMAMRKYGSNDVVVVNKPSGGSQRAVHAILEAISTAPLGEAKIMKFTRTNVGTMLEGTSSTVSVQYVLDEYYNPLPITPDSISLASQNGTLTISGTTFTTTKAGQDRIYIMYNGKVVQSFPVTIVDAPSQMTIKGAQEVVVGATQNYTVEAKDAEGKNLIYNANQVKWSVEGNIGTITSTGQFKATTAGSGKIIATLGSKTVSIPVKVKEKVIFKDVPTNHPYFNEISYSVKNNIVTGYSDGTFRPTENISREHAAVILTRVLKLDTTNVQNPNFKDVPTNYPYYKEIAAAANYGLVSGKNDGTFDPKGKLTRAQMAKILAIAFELHGSESKSTKFKDVPTNHWAYPYIDALAYSKVTTGYEDGTFKPNENINRQHFVLFVYRAIHR